MKIILENKEDYVLRFDPGDEVIVGLATFCEEKGIRAASFTAIGACEKLIFSYYKLQDKEYQDREVEERLEIISLIGNIALLGGKPTVHAHGSFSNRHYTIRGGHVKKLLVSATCEVSLRKLDGEINRAYDDETGLNLMQ